MWNYNIGSFNYSYPSKVVGKTTLLNTQYFISNFMRNGTNQTLIIQNSNSLTFELDLLDSTDNHSSPSSKALKQLSLFVPLNHLLNKNPSLTNFVLFLISQQLLNQDNCTRIESLVTPGRIRSSSSGVTTSISPDLLSLKMKKMFEAPTSTIWFS